MKKLFCRNKRFILTLLGCLLVGAFVPRFVTSAFAMNTIVLSLIWSIMGIGWNFIGGYAGQVSNGHALYYAIGSYAVALGAKSFGMSPWVSMWIGFAVSAALAYLLGKPLLRLNGAYFLIATMAVAECARVIFLNTPALGGATGIMFLDRVHSPWYSLQFKDKRYIYYVLLGIVSLVVILAKTLDRSRFGYYLRAIKANEVAAQSTGINTPKYKMLAYILSAIIVSLAGSLYAPFVTYVDPYTLLPLDKSTMICLVAVMGGVGTVAGPILGAFVMTFISEYARAIFTNHSGMNTFVYGVIVIFIVLYMPNGLVSLFQRKKKAAPAANGKPATKAEGGGGKIG